MRDRNEKRRETGEKDDSEFADVKLWARLGSPGQSQETRRQSGMFRLVRYLISKRNSVCRIARAHCLTSGFGLC